MAHLKRRMIHPDLFADPDFAPPVKAVLFAGMMSIAEDSGCLPWRAEILRGLVLPFAEVSTSEVEALMAEFVEQGRAWTYERSGRTYAFLPDFPAWQGRLIRWNAPDTVPLPRGLTFSPYDAKERAGSGRYVWPKSREALDGKELQALDLNEDKDGTALDLKEPASYQRAGSGQGAGPGTRGREEGESLGEIERLLGYRLGSGERAAYLGLVERHGAPVVADAVFALEGRARGSAIPTEVAKAIACST